MPVKNKLKELRHDYRMNQIEFATYLNVNRQLYNRWEKNQANQPSLEWALKIASKVKRPIEDIFYIIEAE